VGSRRDDEESATVAPFDGGPAEQALRTQTVQVLAEQEANEKNPGAGRWRVLAPVTERGEAIGLLELHLPEEPSAAWRKSLEGLFEMMGHGESSCPGPGSA
jgi:hypothetical protein